MPTPDYYREKETIDKQERVVELLVSYDIQPERAFDAATALKYMDRAGDKPGEGIDADLNKCANYLYRAIMGRWPWESDK